MSLPDVIDSFGSWAWARHHNVLSWYVRPLFLIPLAVAAYRRSGWGIAATLVALTTSMFWFPAPTATDPWVAQFLAFERDWLTGDWTIGKVALTLLVPLFLTAYASYHLIERPCIALAKARPPASLNSRQHNLLPQQPTCN